MENELENMIVVLSFLIGFIFMIMGMSKLYDSAKNNYETSISSAFPYLTIATLIISLSAVSLFLKDLKRGNNNNVVVFNSPDQKPKSEQTSQPKPDPKPKIAKDVSKGLKNERIEPNRN